MWTSLYIIIITVYLTTAERYACPGGVEYIARLISHSESKDFLFYGVQPDIDSSTQCAKFCFETEFCRSAAYNHTAKTCHLAYANVMRCHDSEQPDDRIRANKVGDHLTAVFCIRCPDGKRVLVPEPNTTSSSGSLNLAGDATKTNFITSLSPAGNACFVEFEQMVLLRASYAVESNVRLDECKCKCASTWSASSTSSVRCRSFQYFPDRSECVLNSIARTETFNNRVGNSSNFIEIKAQRSLYYDFACQAASTVENLMSGYCSRIATTKGPVSRDSKANQGDDCFEYVENYILTGLAGGLEHGLSLEECKCRCASSTESGKYDFRCKSAMYYRNERDCVLNLDDRLNRPDLFRSVSEDDLKKDKSYAITYIGLTCQDPKKYVDVQCKKNKDVEKAMSQEATAISIIEATIKVDSGKETSSVAVHEPLPPPGDKTDECFVEIPEYVLTGMASAIQSAMTLEQCKCLCADSALRYGFQCLSIQYYSDVSTCLMNRKNRIQEPSNFKKVISSVPHTYLDYLCSDPTTKRENYWQKKCVSQKLRPLTNGTSASTLSSTVSSTTSTPKSTSSTTQASQSPTTPNPSPAFAITEIHTATTTQQSSAADSTTSRVLISGPCRYSAFYATEFNGRRMIERIVVGDPAACFQNCAQKRCKSVNILAFFGRYKYCELFLDSSLDYPNTSLTTYNANSAYFDGVQCQRL